MALNIEFLLFVFQKKYDEEKLKQDADFLHGEINDLRNSISDINKEINNQTQTKKKLVWKKIFSF